jgi:hypothetical protein
MNTEPMQTPTTRAEFERNFHLLQESMRQEKFKSCVSLENLARVRFLPNGRIDFLSVDESTRCLVNSMAHFNNDRMKSMLDDSKDSSVNM